MAEFSNTNCLWADRRKWDVDALNELVPAQGAVTGKNNRALELFRQFSNAYYDLYNNGGGNWDCRGQGFRNVCKVFGFKVTGVNGLSLRNMRWEIIESRRGFMAELERLGDLVIDAALAKQAETLRAKRSAVA